MGLVVVIVTSVKVVQLAWQRLLLHRMRQLTLERLQRDKRHSDAGLLRGGRCTAAYLLQACRRSPGGGFTGRPVYFRTRAK